MKNAAELLVGAVARALADQRRVMLFGDSFELLQLLAEAPVKELVVVSAMVEQVDSSGQTTLGAPLRLRPDAKERASSKDLIVDLDGTAPADAVKRVLKNSGIYLTAVPGPALAGLAEPTAIEGRYVTAVVTEGGRPTPVRLDNGETADPIIVHMAGKSHAIASPGLICTLPASLAPVASGGASGEESARLSDLEAQVVDAENRVAHLEAELQDAEAHLEAQGTALEAAEALGQRMLILEDDLMAARAKRDDAEAALAPLKARLAEADARLVEVEADCTAARDELAERRVDDRRYGSLRERFEAARVELVAEVDELRAQLRQVGGEVDDVAALIEARDAARQTFARLVDRLVPALQAHLDLAIPGAPPAWTRDAVDGWLDATCALLAGRADRSPITVTTQAIVAPTAPVIAPAPTHPRAVPINEPASQARIAALEAQLQAAHAERVAANAAWQDRLAAADAALADRDQLLTELRASHANASQARLAHIAAEARAERLRAEVQLRDQRMGDLEGVIAAHVRMEGLLTDALDAAELDRDDAVSAQRSLAANLRTLQDEFERASNA